MKKNLIRALLLGLGALVPVAACSSSGGSSTTSTGSGSQAGSCQQLCDATLGAMCSNDTAEDCLAECEAGQADLAECGEAGLALYGCAAGLDWSCDADGTAQLSNSDQLLTECGTEYFGILKCSACQVDAEDDACQTCQKTNCCAEVGAVYDAPDAAAYLLCTQNCMDGACYEACATASPEVVAKQQVAMDCFQTKCASDCNN